MAPTVGYSSVEKNVLIKAAFITVFVILLHFDFLPLFFKKAQDISLPEKKSER